MNQRLNSPAAPRAVSFARLVLVASWIALIALAGALAGPASATVNGVAIDPPTPTLCDSVGLVVEGALPSLCHTILEFRVGSPEPLPTMGPIPTYRIRANVLVVAPDEQRYCPPELAPYRLTHELGKLPFGRYWVDAHEYVYAYPAGLAPPIDSSVVYANFSVGMDSCATDPGCVFFDFVEAGTELMRLEGCTARTLAGGRACFDVTLANATPVGGFQTAVAIPTGGGAWVADFPNLIVPIEVTATGRAAGFQAAWTHDGTETKIVVYSPSGAVIEPGRGPVLHLCYDVKEGTPEGSYRIGFGRTLVSTSAGDVIPLCPTFAEVTGRLCVGTGGCDLNGDGVGDIRDILRLVRCVLTGPDACAGADCNGDALVDVRDIICCVRKSLSGDAGWGPIAPVASVYPTDVTGIQFEGPAEWTSPFEARAVVAIDRSASFGGIQFEINPGPSARVARVTLDDPRGASSLDWSRTADGRARIMIYPSGELGSAGSGSGLPSKSGTAALGVARVRLMLEPTGGQSEEGYVALQTVRGATSTGELLGIGSYAASVPLEANPASAAPAILPARPNPFVSETEISFALPSAASVSLRLFDVNGRLVRTLHEGPADAGVHRLRWDGRDDGGRNVSVGIYFVRLDAGSTLRTERILRLR